MKYFLLWILTMIVLPFMVNAALPEWSTFEFIILLADILLGIYAWAIFNLRLEKRIKSKLPNWRGSIMTAFTFLGTLIGGVTLVVGLLTINYNKYVKFKTPSYTSAVPLIKERLVIDEVKLGSTGDDVVVLQTLLYQDTEVYRGPASGYFGEVTRQGALKFQKKHGLDQSGIADLPTRNKLSEIYSYQTREYWLSMIRLMPIIAPITQSTQNVSNNAKWGVSERVEGTEHGWAMTLGITGKRVYHWMTLGKVRKLPSKLRTSSREIMRQISPSDGVGMTFGEKHFSKDPNINEATSTGKQGKEFYERLKKVGLLDNEEK